MIAARITDALRTRVAAPWSYGSHDCATFANGVLHDVFGRDVLLESGLAWSSAREAAVTRRAHGGLVGVVRHALGEPIEMRQARAGDLVVADVSPWHCSRPWWAVGVHTGTGAVFATQPRGWVSLGLSRCTHAWRVG